MEAFEFVAVGIVGKCGLCVALAECASSGLHVRGLNHDRLTARAVEQRQWIEGV